MAIQSLKVLTLTVALMLVAFAAQAQAQDVSDTDRRAFETVITNQMNAFRADDDVLAWSFAAPRIKEIFGSPDRFMAMVRNGYKPVYRPRAVMFGDVVAGRDGPTQEVHLIGPDGLAWIALYTMQLQDDGNWRILGCQLVRSPDAGA